MTSAYVGIGSNLDDPRQQVQRAVTALNQLPHTDLVAVSRWYRSRAVGPGEQPDYINGAALLETRLDSRQLLDELHRLEREAGRVRSQRWGPRPLDLDLLAYGDEITTDPELTLPHPRIAERAFVLLPLRDLDARFRLTDGTSVDQLAATVSAGDCHVIDPGC